MRRTRGARLTVAAVLLSALPAALSANQRSDALRSEAARHVYNLDRDDGLALYRQAIAADPEDAGAYRGLATGLWLSITFRRGNMTVDDYLGRVTKPTGPTAQGPTESAKAFTDAVERAQAIARQR